MKKLVAVIVLFSLMMVGCTSEKEIKKNETLLKYYETSEDYFDYKSIFFDFRLPVFWRGKYIVDVHENHEDFYEMTSFEEDGTGLLFSIYAYDDKSYKKEHNDYRYLAYHEDLGKHYIFVYPDEEKYIESAEQVYNDLKEALSIVLYTFKM